MYFLFWNEREVIRKHDVSYEKGEGCYLIQVWGREGIFNERNTVVWKISKSLSTLVLVIKYKN